MQFKTYIAIFFTVIFFGKFLMLDAKVLSSIFDTQEIALVNPFCDKKMQKSADADTFSKESSILIISSEAMCNAPFYLSKIAWPGVEKINNFQDYGYFNPAVISTYFSKNYPPPKILVA
ncbi:hypothetical protein LB467_17915 [Salegentibacter sp. JZCK2]|uniref:hypothetical protein n=1 Tax=Salegentibacter tibetensis TaxID=2873600 RepID=UPI001CCF716F|nr:hypothetical protein [Salegentibacter tibetensis]MBZ9731566.1 hypothetical protein [Salegentibacter tibetensis]